MAPAPLAPPPGVGPMETSAEDRKKFGRPHPYKPQTPAQIAEFASMWFDGAYKNDQIARRYKTVERTISRWRTEFGLPPRDEALRQKGEADSITGAASAAISGLNQAVAITNAMARAGQPQGPAVAGTLVDPKKFDPLQDKEIADMLDDVRSEARIMTAHSDLQHLQRKLMKLTVVAATKVPTRSWEGLTVVIEALQRAVLNARRVEAEIPGSAADPVLLRKEAASQMMKELKSVLTPTEQAALATLVKAGADRLMAKGGDGGASVVSGSVDA